MQIKRLKVSDNKCLVDFDIKMLIDREKGSSTILIGENGTGKSTMLKTILEIMMSFESPSIEDQIKYNYEMHYFFKGNDIVLVKHKKQYEIKVNDDFTFYGSMKTFKKEFSSIMRSIIPERVNYSYSGENNQTIELFKRIEINYNTDCRNQIARYWNALYLQNHEYSGEFSKRRFNYCNESLIPAYLVSIFSKDDSYEQRCVIEQCRITAIDTISVNININDTLRNKLSNDILEIGEEGVFDLISFIDDRFIDHFRRGFLYQNGSRFFFELHNVDKIDADSIAFFNFFEKLITLLDAELTPFIMVGNTRVSCSDLSEGQRQLIKILGMLSICKSEDTLVLMDEPDAHMNPKWKYDLKTIIDSCLEEAVNTQALIATHDPLVINGVDREFIRVFTYNPAIIQNNHWYITKVIEPTEKTEGLGIDGLLQSEYYGLKTSYDRKTSDEFIRRQELYSKLINKQATDTEKDELRILTRKLGSLPISYNSIDFLYDDFIRIYRNSDLFSKEYLSYEDIQRRRDKIKEIITALYEGQNEIH